MAIDRNIKLVRGDTLSFDIKMIDFNEVVDFSSAYFTARQDYGGTVLFQKSLGSGISKVEDGVYRVKLAPEDTQNAVSGMYVYDLQIGISNDIYTLMRGILELQHDVTED